jgi:hypothetical protein
MGTKIRSAQYGRYVDRGCLVPREKSEAAGSIMTGARTEHQNSLDIRAIGETAGGFLRSNTDHIHVSFGESGQEIVDVNDASSKRMKAIVNHASHLKNMKPFRGESSHPVAPYDGRVCLQ